MKFVAEFTIIEDDDEAGADAPTHAMAGHTAQRAIRAYIRAKDNNDHFDMFLRYSTMWHGY
jgi:hypothetical protein